MMINFSAYSIPELEAQLDQLHHRLDMVNVAIEEAEEKYAIEPYKDFGYLRVDIDHWCTFLDEEREMLQVLISKKTKEIVEMKSRLRGY